jgi:hypothetical protein
MYTDKGFSTAWAMYGERRGTYSNVPSKRYGSQGVVYATTHAPNQVMIEMRRFGLFSFRTSGPFMILTFRPETGHLGVEWVDHAGWRGEGELWRLPAAVQQR